MDECRVMSETIFTCRQQAGRSYSGSKLRAVHGCRQSTKRPPARAPPDLSCAWDGSG
jgi:hypothetical protein